MNHIPPIVAVMTPFPFWVEADDSLEKAAAMMSKHEIRHLPVKRDGELVGVLSERDIRRAARRADPTALQVGEACTHEAYIVPVDEPLDLVLVQLAERHIGAVLVVKEGRLAGIFTSTDACRCFAEFLLDFFPRDDGNEAA